MNKVPSLNVLFPKKEFTISHETESSFCYQSQRMVSSSVFPHHSIIPRKFDINKLEEKIPKFWKLKHNDAGEPLLTREQIEQLKREIIKERTNELNAKYTETMSSFMDRLGKSIEVSKEIENNNNNNNNFDNMFL